MRRVVSLVVAVIVALALGCEEAGPEGTTGAQGKVVFQAETPLVFSSRVAVGSTFQIAIVPKNADVALSNEAVLGSGDDNVLAVTAVEALLFDVVITGPGRVELTVSDGGASIDSIFIEAARPVDTALVDAELLSASDAVDPRLPARFALIDDGPTRFLVSTLDKCGGPLLDLGASSVVVTGGEGVDPTSLATVTADGAAAFLVEPVLGAGGSFSVELLTPEVEGLSYDVDVVERGDIDEVHAEVAAVDTAAATVRLWGRAFVNDVDVIGLSYDWSTDLRVALDAGQGPAVTATVAFEADENGVDLRPATVSAEVFGTDDTRDLLVVQTSDLVTARDAGPVRSSPAVLDDDAATGGATCASCEGGNACNALAVGAAWALKRRRQGLRQRQPQP